MVFEKEVMTQKYLTLPLTESKEHFCVNLRNMTLSSGGNLSIFDLLNCKVGHNNSS